MVPGPAAWHHHAEQPAQRERWAAQETGQMFPRYPPLRAGWRWRFSHETSVQINSALPPETRKSNHISDKFGRSSWSLLRAELSNELVGTCSFWRRVPSLKISGKNVQFLSISVLFIARLSHKSVHRLITDICYCFSASFCLLSLACVPSHSITCCFISSYFVTCCHILSHVVTFLSHVVTSCLVTFLSHSCHIPSHSNIFHHILSHSITVHHMSVYTYVCIYTLLPDIIWYCIKIILYTHHIHIKYTSYIYSQFYSFFFQRVTLWSGATSLATGPGGSAIQRLQARPGAGHWCGCHTASGGLKIGWVILKISGLLPVFLNVNCTTYQSMVVCD